MHTSHQINLNDKERIASNAQMKWNKYKISTTEKVETKDSWKMKSIK